MEKTSGSQSVLRGSRGIRDQLPGDPSLHFCMATLQFTYLFITRIMFG